jgi:phosphoglycolate phosphatase-like HAD superfamily hydrolase
MLRLITDFDGPIMDVSERYYRTYLFCLSEMSRPDQAIQVLSKAEFWQLKRSQVPEREIGQISGLDQSQTQAFAQLRRQTVHTLPYLIYDLPTPGAIATLEQAQQAGIEMVVMTMRRVKELNDAFDRFDLARFFPPDRRYCLSNDYVKTTDVKDKPLLMERALAELPAAADTWMVGDTEADIAAAKTHGVKVIGVLCGIRDRVQLMQYEPNAIADDLSDAIAMILKSTPTSSQTVSSSLETTSN